MPLMCSCFATGARDGTGRLWEYRRGEWHSTILPVCQLGEAYLKGDNLSSKWKRQVTMVSLRVTSCPSLTSSSVVCLLHQFKLGWTMPSTDGGEVIEWYTYIVNNVD